MFRSFSAQDDLCAFGFCVVDVFEDLFNGRGVDEGTLCGLWIKTKSEFEFRYFLLEKLSELVVYLFMDEKTIRTIVRLKIWEGCTKHKSVLNF
jgi:hypothetical protein